jgi:hypothetical protein
MVAVPADTPVTTPDVALTVATAAFPLLQTPPKTVDVQAVLLFTQIDCIPPKIPAFVPAFIVMVRVEVALAQPPLPKTV